MLSHSDCSSFKEMYFGLEFSVTVKARKENDNDPMREPYKNVNLPGPFSGLEVTYANRADYVKAMVHWHTGGDVEPVLKEFRSGFLEVCGGPVFDHFLPEQLETLIRGDDVEVDFTDLQNVAVYKEPYHKDHRVILRFWFEFYCVKIYSNTKHRNVFQSLPSDFKHKFLGFMTGSETVPPITGLKGIRICIQPSGCVDPEPTNNAASSPNRGSQAQPLPEIPENDWLQNSIFAPEFGGTQPFESEDENSDSDWTDASEAGNDTQDVEFEESHADEQCQGSSGSLKRPREEEEEDDGISVPNTKRIKADHPHVELESSYTDFHFDTTLDDVLLDGETEETRLPCAHTCSFVLDLPAYKTCKQLMEKLVYAVENASEFHLV
jgi:hypothetical protein